MSGWLFELINSGQCLEVNGNMVLFYKFQKSLILAAFLHGTVAPIVVTSYVTLSQIDQSRGRIQCYCENCKNHTALECHCCSGATTAAKTSDQPVMRACGSSSANYDVSLQHFESFLPPMVFLPTRTGIAKSWDSKVTFRTFTLIWPMHYPP